MLLSPFVNDFLYNNHDIADWSCPCLRYCVRVRLFSNPQIERQMMNFLKFVYITMAIALTASCANPGNRQLHWASVDTSIESRRQAHVDPIHPGESVTILEAESPGIVRHLWMTLQSNDPKALGNMRIKAWWDDDPKPAIDVPLGQFFGTGFGEEQLVRSAAVEMIPAGLPGHAAMTCWLEMPFESARIEIVNTGEEEGALFHIVNWEAVETLPPDAGRLYAQHRVSDPIVRGEGHLALDIEGTGKYIGMIYSVERREGGAWVEGGEDFYIDIRDDEREALRAWDKNLVAPDRRVEDEARNIANQPASPAQPTLPGIGGEDYFCQSWGFRPEDRSLYHGVSYYDDELQRMTAYRFHERDPIYFDKNLMVHFRNHGWDVQSRADYISTVCFWYQLPER